MAGRGRRNVTRPDSYDEFARTGDRGRGKNIPTINSKDGDRGDNGHEMDLDTVILEVEQSKQDTLDSPGGDQASDGNKLYMKRSKSTKSKSSTTTKVSAKHRASDGDSNLHKHDKHDNHDDNDAGSQMDAEARVFNEVAALDDEQYMQYMQQRPKAQRQIGRNQETEQMDGTSDNDGTTDGAGS